MTEGFVNQCYLKGTIVNIFKANKGCVIVTVNVGEKNFPQIVCWQQNAKDILKNYQINDTICLLANLQSSKRPSGKITVGIFCSEILPTDYFLEPFYNQFMLRGKTISTVTNKNVISLLIKTVTEHYSTVPITIYNANPRIHVFEEGQPITVIGKIESIKKISPDGKRIFYTNFVAKQLYDSKKI